MIILIRQNYSFFLYIFSLISYRSFAQVLFLLIKCQLKTLNSHLQIRPIKKISKSPTPIPTINKNLQTSNPSLSKIKSHHAKYPSLKTTHKTTDSSQRNSQCPSRVSKTGPSTQSKSTAMNSWLNDYF